MLTLIDEYTRESLAIPCGQKTGQVRGIDNGPEFVAEERRK
jgi:hypothetical protein